MGDIASNLAAHYQFENNGLDSSGNARHLTLTGTMPYVTGRIGNGCTPNATNFWNYANPTWWDSLPAWTWAAWCWDTAFASNECMLSWGTANASFVQVYYPFNINNGNGFACFIKGVSQPIKLTNSRPAVSGVPQHVAMVCESSTSTKLYINGALETTNTTTNFVTTAGATSLRVGMYHNGGQGYSGGLDELRFYTRALTLADIGDLYAYTGATFKSAFARGSNQLIGLN